MLDEYNIKSNKVCYLDGYACGLGEFIFNASQAGKNTVKLDELVAAYKHAQAEYERAWNKWADENHIGGSRFDESGEQRPRRD